MKDFEASAEPLQDWLNVTEQAVQESSTRLHDLAAKKQELHKLQVKPPRRSLILVLDWTLTPLHHESLEIIPPRPPRTSTPKTPSSRSHHFNHFHLRQNQP